MGLTSGDAGMMWILSQRAHVRGRSSFRASAAEKQVEEHRARSAHGAGHTVRQRLYLEAFDDQNGGSADQSHEEITHPRDPIQLAKIIVIS